MIVFPILFRNGAFVYTTPKAPFLNKIGNTIIADWQIGGFAIYQSGQ